MKTIGSSEKLKLISDRELDVTEVDIDKNNLEESMNNIKKFSKQLFVRKEKAVFLGGDHSISYSTAKAFFDSEKDGFLIVCRFYMQLRQDRRH